MIATNGDVRYTFDFWKSYEAYQEKMVNDPEYTPEWDYCADLVSNDSISSTYAAVYAAGIMEYKEFDYCEFRSHGNKRPLQGRIYFDSKSSCYKVKTRAYGTKEDFYDFEDKTYEIPCSVL